jgi:hypothetical protein
MNVALFLTKSNLEKMQAYAEAVSASQDEVVNGALVVIKSTAVSDKQAADVVSSLRQKFKTANLISAQIQEVKIETRNLSGMFAVFFTKAYAAFPGAWLIVDDAEWMPVGPNPLTRFERQHILGGGGVTGRFLFSYGAAVPIGPTIINLPVRSIGLLRYPSDSGWRDRGKYTFARSKPVQLEADQWPFRHGAEFAKEALLAPEASAPEAEASVEVEYEGLEDLFQEVERLTGSRPHHRTGREKLMQIIDGFTSKAP